MLSRDRQLRGELFTDSRGQSFHEALGFEKQRDPGQQTDMPAKGDDARPGARIKLERGLWLPEEAQEKLAAASARAG